MARSAARLKMGYYPLPESEGSLGARGKRQDGETSVPHMNGRLWRALA